MLNIRISTLLWITALVCVVLLSSVQHAKQDRQIQGLTGQLKELQKRSMFSPNYADLDVFVGESDNGSVNISGGRIIP